MAHTRRSRGEALSNLTNQDGPEGTLETSRSDKNHRMTTRSDSRPRKRGRAPGNSQNKRSESASVLQESSQNEADPSQEAAPPQKRRRVHGASQATVAAAQTAATPAASENPSSDPSERPDKDSVQELLVDSVEQNVEPSSQGTATTVLDKEGLRKYFFRHLATRRGRADAPIPQMEPDDPPANSGDIPRKLQDHRAVLPPFSPSVFNHFRELEWRYEISPTYMEDVQTDVSPAMRAILVDWLVEVIEEYRLMPETLYLAVQYIDRYLSMYSISRGKLQLLGCAAMLVASKFEEIFAPSIEEFVYISDNTYSREQILEMERILLQRLEYRLKGATVKTYMARFLFASGARRGGMETSLVKYLAEMTLPEYRFLKYRPSEVSAAVVLCARRTLGVEQEWTHVLEHFTGYTAEQLMPCVHDIAQTHRDSQRVHLQAIREKYSRSPYSHVARAVAPLQMELEGGVTVEEGTEFSLSSASGIQSNTY